MMAEVDFMNVLHKSTKRDYLARVNDTNYPKAKAAELAKNSLKIIGMETEEFVTGVINTLKGGGKKLHA